MEWIATLLLIPFALPMLLGFVTMCCCGASSSGCTNACDSGTKPANITITIAGIVDDLGGCTLGVCDDLNGTWVIPQGPACSGSNAITSPNYCEVNDMASMFFGGVGVVTQFEVTLAFTAASSDNIIYRNTDISGVGETGPIACNVGLITLPLTTNPTVGTVKCRSDGTSITADLSL